MGIKERKAREKEELRERILDAARVILLRDGHDGLSIRKVAKAIEYSPGTIYLYYKDKDELMLALHRDAFQRKGSLFAPLLGITDYTARLEAMGRAYIQHAVDSPADFHLMFVDKCPIQRLQEEGQDWRNGQTALDMLKACIRGGQEAGVFRSDLDPDSMSIVLWSLVHGYAMLADSNRIEAATPGETSDHVLDDLFHQINQMVVAY